jgi:hypothetical protein
METDAASEFKDKLSGLEHNKDFKQLNEDTRVDVRRNDIKRRKEVERELVNVGPDGLADVSALNVKDLSRKERKALDENLDQLVPTSEIVEKGPMGVIDALFMSGDEKRSRKLAKVAEMDREKIESFTGEDLKAAGSIGDAIKGQDQKKDKERDARAKKSGYDAGSGGSGGKMAIEGTLHVVGANGQPLYDAHVNASRKGYGGG